MSWKYLKFNHSNEVHEIVSNCQFNPDKIECDITEKCKDHMMPKCPLRVIRDNIKWLKEE